MAHLGHDVVAYDTDGSKIATLAAGRSPFYEPGLEDLFAEVLETGRLRFTDSAAEAASGAAVHFICVGTPQWDEYRAIDPVAFRSLVRSPRLLDTRNAVDLDYWSNAGWQVYALGRGALNV
jgi:UDPglucose 6-dehydrogenase